MKGKNPTAKDKRFWDAICEIGCIVCFNTFNEFTPGTIHHIDGRTKPGAHKSVLCLCARHHQVASDTGEWVTRHGPGRKSGKAMFEAAYGTEQELLNKTMELLNV